MFLELKESNSPFWLIGLSNGKITAGSSTNIPMYYKSAKKQYEIANTVINNPGIDEVYLITGIVWDNMKGSWNAKEAGSYVQNKGKLIVSKNEITSYAERYENIKVNEGKYPKGVSRDPLPKKGVKTYTSVATALEDKGDNKMSLELKEEKIVNVDDIPEDLQDRFFTTMGDGRPELFKKFTKDELKLFADFVKQLPANEVTNLERNMVLVAISLAHGDDLTVESINDNSDEENLELELDAKHESNQYTSQFKPGDVVKFIKPGDELSEEEAMIVGYDDDGFYEVKWSDGKTSNGLHDKNLELVSKSELKESKIVTPVGNPQTAGSFVNIDVDVDHMEVSDFIVRLAQAIRSEQTSVLEYVALRSANGITNEDRTVIDGIIEEEKNHMVALSTLLYKQLLLNHKQNVDGANNEFELPKFGADLFGEDNKLKESINTTLEKIITKESSRDVANDEFFVGNMMSGRTYKGLQTALDVVKNDVSSSNEVVVIQNMTLNDGLDESLKLEYAFNSEYELIKELETDTNYDEIALHIHEYSKKDKATALDLMDKLFELEKTKSPKECRDEIIALLKPETKTEDAKINATSSTMSQDQYEIEVDVDYDADFQAKVAKNLGDAIKKLNPETAKNDKYAISETPGSYKLGEKFKFILLTYNGFNKSVTEEFLNGVCERLFNEASTYEYYITLA